MDFKLSLQGGCTLLLKRYAGPFWFRRRELERTQWLPSEGLREFQLDRLRKLVRHCYATVPHYRKLMSDRGIKPDGLRELADIESFPVLAKRDVLEAGLELHSRKYPRWFRRTAYTGGTTGTPLALQRDVFSIGNEHAFVRRQYDWAGIRLRDRCAYLTGRLVANPNQTDRLYGYDPFMNELVLSTYHLSPQTARQYAEAIRRYKVRALVGYPSAVHLLAQACEEDGPALRLSAVLTSSETLTDLVRRTIESTFQCRVFDSYGSAERVCYVYTCEAGSYHILSEYGLAELVPVDETDPACCRVVSTGFWNMAMPLIRYDLGDIVIRSDRACRCGRAMPVIDRIVGRQGDRVVTPSGRQFGAAVLTHLLYGARNIHESQIIQDAVDHLVIEYVPTRRFSEDDMQAFRDLIKKHLPGELRVDFKQVDAVERTQSGKVRPVVSKIASSPAPSGQGARTG